MGRPIKKSMRVLISHKSALILMRQESFRRFAVAFSKIRILLHKSFLSYLMLLQPMKFCKIFLKRKRISLLMYWFLTLFAGIDQRRFRLMFLVSHYRKTLLSTLLESFIVFLHHFCRSLCHERLAFLS